MMQGILVYMALGLALLLIAVVYLPPDQLRQHHSRHGSPYIVAVIVATAVLWPLFIIKGIKREFRK